MEMTEWIDDIFSAVVEIHEFDEEDVCAQKDVAHC